MPAKLRECKEKAEASSSNDDDDSNPEQKPSSTSNSSSDEDHTHKGIPLGRYKRRTSCRRPSSGRSRRGIRRSRSKKR